MNNAVINIKTDPKIKKQAQKVADELGFSLSSMINGYLKQLVRTKRIDFSLEEPSEYLKNMLKKSEEDIKNGKFSPRFTNAEDAIKWLEDQGI